MSKAEQLLRLMEGKKYNNKLGHDLSDTVDGKSVKYKFKKISGAFEAGMDLDVEFSVGPDKFTYKGDWDYNTTKNGKKIQPDEHDETLDMSPDMFVQYLISKYAKALGASDKEVKDLENLEGWSFDSSGNLIGD